MSGFECPFCGVVMPEISETTSQTPYVFQKGVLDDVRSYVAQYRPKPDFTVVVNKCPSCHELSISVLAKNVDGTEYRVWVRPKAIYKNFPDYVPQSIRQDYEEASAIVNLSPKASATLSRRCLQGMIRDFWGISKNRLVDEIDALKSKIPADQWRVIDGVRRIGNIGAHMEKEINLIVDIETDEAQKLLKLIELLIKNWYIDRQEQMDLYDDILAIDQDKQELKQSQ